jgi:hypothetical protein
MRIPYFGHVESLHNQNDFLTLLCRELDVLHVWGQKVADTLKVSKPLEIYH